MPGNILQADIGYPDLSRYESTEAKLNAVQNYLFLLLENLRYILRNLSPENFNEQETLDWIGRNIKAETRSSPMSCTPTTAPSPISWWTSYAPTIRRPRATSPGTRRPSTFSTSTTRT